jgi:hypothetical protein
VVVPPLVGEHREQDEQQEQSGDPRDGAEAGAGGGIAEHEGRVASAGLVIGLTSANHHTPVGMVSTETRAELAKVSGTIPTTPAL